MDVLKFNLVVLSGLVQVFCLQTHASIGTLFGVGQHREIDHGIIHGLKVGVSIGVQFYLAAFGFSGATNEELGVAGIGAGDAFISAWWGNLLNVSIILGIAHTTTKE